MAKPTSTQNLQRGPGQLRSLPAQKPRKIWPTTKRLLKYLRPMYAFIGLSIFLTIAATLMQVFTPKMLGNATTLIYNGATGNGINFYRLGTILGIVALFYFGQSALNFALGWIMTFVSQKTSYTLRNELKQKMNTLPVDYFDKHSNSNLMSIAVNDMDNIASALQQSLLQLISNTIFIIGVLALMLYISWQMTLVACIIIPGSIIVTKIISPPLQRNLRKYLKLQGELNAHIEESFNGFKILKSFNGETAAIEKFESANQEMYTSGWKAKFYGGALIPCVMLMRNLGYVGTAVFGAAKVAAGSVVIGDMQAFLQYSTQFTQPMTSFAQIWNSLISMVSSAERVFDVLDAPDMVEYEGAFADDRQPENKITFEHVQFGYDEKLLMHDVNLNVKTGQMLAVVGHTGAGKTTLINLLERFYEISGGSIKIDGVDIRNLPREELHAKIGMVLQDTWLFAGTIFDNIHYGNAGAGEEQVCTAAKAAYVDEFVKRLPDGYQTLLNEDAGNISQGQRQLITIARAFVADPEILILDEATSNVDSRTEMLIQAAMRKLLRGRTSFVIAHRLSTIYDADNIIVMNHGDIVEIGTHRELLAKNGLYADIYNAQFAFEDGGQGRFSGSLAANAARDCTQSVL